MSAKINKLTIALIALAFWILLWEVFARFLNLGLVLPTVGETFSALGSMIITAGFWLTVASSFLRIFAGFIIGVVLGIALALATQYIPFADALISPIMTVIRSTPVASFIMVLWVVIGSDTTPIAIAVLMIMPIIWQNLKDGFSSIDDKLSEVCLVFEVTGAKKMKLLVLPTLAKYFIPGVITSVGLAWKSGIAAEIIAYTANSIGKEIYLAKSYFESAEMFAWTIVVIAVSLALESIVTLLGRRLDKNGS